MDHAINRLFQKRFAKMLCLEYLLRRKQPLDGLLDDDLLKGYPRQRLVSFRNQLINCMRADISGAT